MFASVEESKTRYVYKRIPVAEDKILTTWKLNRLLWDESSDRPDAQRRVAALHICRITGFE